MPKEAKVVVMDATDRIPAMNQDISSIFFEGKSGRFFEVMSPKNKTYKAMRINTARSEKKTAVLSLKYKKIFRLVNAIIDSSLPLPLIAMNTSSKLDFRTSNDVIKSVNFVKIGIASVVSSSEIWKIDFSSSKGIVFGK